MAQTAAPHSAWGLSLSVARRHSPDTVLVTDQRGKKLLVETLGLQFSSVSTELECLDQCDPEWWAANDCL